MIGISRRAVVCNGLAFTGLLAGLVPSHAQWTPQKAIEFIVPTAAGSTMDLLARVLQDIWQKNRLIDATMTVQAKPGAGGGVAWTYLSRKTGDGHYIAISGPTLLANDVLGIGELSYKDVTPIAQLFTEYEVFTVNSDSAIKNGVDLVNALKSSSPPSIAVAPGIGGSSHVALLRLARTAGIDPEKLTIVPFKGANESVNALLGGHVDVAIGTLSLFAPFLEADKLRAFSIAAPKRLEGAQSSIPTWKEQGFDVVEGNWRGVVGPKDLSEAEVTFWVGKLADAVKTEEWKTTLKRNYWDADFVTGPAAKRFLETQYQDLRSTLANLHPAK
jgi:putative tricarboxylic transport membrane protein